MTNEVKKNILLVAKSLFGEKGFENTSVRDISKRAKVNVAMIAYYFGCKEHLYVSCLSEFSQAKVQRLHEILVAPKDAEDFKLKIRTMLNVMIESYEDEAPLLKILLREMHGGKKKMARDVLELTSPFFLTIRNFFQQAIDAKIISPDMSANFITIIFLGALSKPIHSEYAIKQVVGLTMHDPEFQKEYMRHLLEIFLNGVVK